MTALSQPAFDIWEFVACCRCHLVFSVDGSNAPQIPFWLTECGHIMCNNHLNADQSCSLCGRHGIQLVPLQREMDVPMSSWFRAVPYALDEIAAAVKFQQDTLSEQARYYKGRARMAIDKLKVMANEKRQMQDENEQLRQHLQQLQERGGYDLPNERGKRPRLESARPETMSNPHSVNSSLGSHRLTLPPDQSQNAPTFSSRPRHSDPHIHNVSPQQRPGSSRFIEQYAHNPNHSAQYQPPQLSYAQAGPSRQLQSRSTAQQTQAMMPPPQHSHGQNTKRSAYDTDRSINTQMPMGPPPTPQRVQATIARTPNNHIDDRFAYQAQAQAPHVPKNNLATIRRVAPTPSTNRFLPSNTSHGGTGGYRFVQPGPTGGGGSQRFTGGGRVGTGEQRAPFGAGNGFR